MASVEGAGRRLVVGMERRPCGLVPQKRILNLGREIEAKPVGLRDPERHRGGGVRDDEGLEPGRPTDRMFGAQHAAPGLPDEVVAPGDAEMGQEVVEFGEEEVDGPEAGAAVAQVGRAAVAELVVVHDGAAGTRARSLKLST